MPAIAITAPAKINFGLRIVGVRDDGYHLLDSLFVPLELADELRVEVEPGRASGGGVPVELDLAAGDAPGAETVPADGDNLVVRAAQAFLQRLGPGAEVAAVRVRLRKRIPAAAGLGGGSSDAGAVLRALSRLLPAGPQGAALARCALGLGADVPFFLDPRPSRVTGIGERIEPFEGLPRLAVVLANPRISLSTADVYRAYDRAPARLTVPDPGPTMRALSGLGGDPSSLSRLPGFSNDLEAAAIGLCPEVGRLRDLLRGAGALWAGMSGSGPTVYGVFATGAEAEIAREREDFPDSTWTAVTHFASGNGAQAPSETEQQPEK